MEASADPRRSASAAHDDSAAVRSAQERSAAQHNEATHDRDQNGRRRRRAEREPPQLGRTNGNSRHDGNGADETEQQSHSKPEIPLQCRLSPPDAPAMSTFPDSIKPLHPAGSYDSPLARGVAVPESATGLATWVPVFARCSPGVQRWRRPPDRHPASR